MMSQHSLTALQIELNAMTPGEVRTHLAVVETPRDESRFYRINTLGEALLAHTPFWKNEPKPELIPSRTPRPRLPHIPELPPIPLSAPEPPVIVFDGRAAQFGHLYRSSWATLVAEPLLGCILELDGQTIDYVPVRIVDRRGKPRSDLPKCFFIMPTRAIDCIDTERTTVRLSFLDPLPGIAKPMRMCEFDGYSVRGDIPGDVHIFSNVFNGDLLFSVELIEQARLRGVWGIWARRPEKGMAELSMNF